jgi:hypothetical protein
LIAQPGQPKLRAMRFAVMVLGTAFFLGACGGKVFVDSAGSAGSAGGAGGSSIPGSDAGLGDIPPSQRQCAAQAD